MDPSKIFQKRQILNSYKAGNTKTRNLFDQNQQELTGIKKNQQESKGIKWNQQESPGIKEIPNFWKYLGVKNRIKFHECMFLPLQIQIWIVSQKPYWNNF